MNSPKKIGLMACTGIVAGNMMGSGIALLPSNLASIGSVALFGWAIGNLAIAVTAVSYLSVFFPILNEPIWAGIACVGVVWFFTLLNLLGGSFIGKLT